MNSGTTRFLPASKTKVTMIRARRRLSLLPLIVCFLVNQDQCLAASPLRAGKIGPCEVGCDANDAKCELGSSCLHHRGNGKDEVVPGCEEETQDVAKAIYMCYEPFDGVLVHAGNVKNGKGFPKSAFPLKECAGNCKSDDDCESGLTCIKHGGKEIFGCTGYGIPSLSYCHDPTKGEGKKENPTKPPESTKELVTSEEAAPYLLCEGNCKGDDSLCDLGLSCFSRKKKELVLGCEGEGKFGIDYCYSPPEGVLVVKQFVEQGDLEEELEQCQGSCKNNSDCKGNLECFTRTGTEEVPGCTGYGIKSVGYCYDPDDSDKESNPKPPEETTSPESTKEPNETPSPAPSKEPTASKPTQGSSGSAATPDGYNCEPLNDFYQVRWQVQDDKIAIELVGLIDDGVYMGFGVSGSDSGTAMVGGDVAVGDWWNGNARVRDFYMNAMSPCDDGTGVCPEDEETFVNDVYKVTGSQEGGLTVIRYMRPLTPSNVDDTANGTPVDAAISDDSVSRRFIWALGPIDESSGNPEYHNIDHGGTSLKIGRKVQDNCVPLVEEGSPPSSSSPAPSAPSPEVTDTAAPTLASSSEITDTVAPTLASSATSEPSEVALSIVDKTGNTTLGLCEGDCKGNDEVCEAGLVCFVREEKEEVPGCAGRGTKGVSYCYMNSTSPASTSSPAPSASPGNETSTSAPSASSGNSTLPPTSTPASNKTNSTTLTIVDDPPMLTLGNCQGPCGGDDLMCNFGLSCFQRTGSEEVPGCEGAGSPGKFYCHKPPRGVLVYSADDFEEGKFPLEECHGDCDEDGDCQEGLECYFREDLEPVPGCLGLGITGRDYCYNTSNPEPPISLSPSAASQTASISFVLLGVFLAVTQCGCI